MSNADPVPRLFAEFQALLDRHVAAIVNRDGIKVALVDRIGWPRVALPGGSGGVRRHAADATTIGRLCRVTDAAGASCNACADGSVGGTRQP